ncbi:MAG: acyltransferase [Gallionella sp.]
MTDKFGLPTGSVPENFDPKKISAAIGSIDQLKRYSFSALGAHGFATSCSVLSAMEHSELAAICTIKRIGNCSGVLEDITITIAGYCSAQLVLNFGLGGHTALLGDALSGAWDIRFWRESTLVIGRGTTCSGARVVLDNSFVFFGEDCMFSDEIIVQSHDQHAIVSIDDGKIINQKRRDLIIDDHVWIGCRTMVMGGIKIGIGSVVAAGSIVTKDVPRHCIVAGNPANIIRTNVTWSRNPDDLDEYAKKLCGPENNGSAGFPVVAEAEYRSRPPHGE